MRLNYSFGAIVDKAVIATHIPVADPHATPGDKTMLATRDVGAFRLARSLEVLLDEIRRYARLLPADVARRQVNLATIARNSVCEFSRAIEPYGEADAIVAVPAAEPAAQSLPSNVIPLHGRPNRGRIFD